MYPILKLISCIALLVLAKHSSKVANAFAKVSDFNPSFFAKEEFIRYDKIDNNNSESDYHVLKKRQTSFSNFPNRQFDPCKTPYGEDGHCKHITYCQMPQLKDNVWKIVDHLCIIEKQSIGICCPDSFINRQTGPSFAPTVNDAAVDPIGDSRIVNRGPSSRPEERGCGITTKQFPRISGGRPAEPEEWPWMAAIIRKGFPYAYCGGVLITDRHVLSAAHCIYKLKIADLFVRLGEYDFKQYNETRSRDFRIAAMVHHIDFDPINFENDVCIIRVERPTIFNTYIWPVCMPPIGENWEGRNAIVTGWGTQHFGGPHSSILMEVNLPIWKLEKCREMFVEKVSDNVMCAGAEEGGRDSCQGDSGGPLLVQLPNNRWVTVGIVSWGIRCGEENRPGLYTRVDKFIQWIIEHSDI